MDNTKVLDDSANGKRFYKKCINFLGILAFGGVGEGVQVLVRLVCGKLFISILLTCRDILRMAFGKKKVTQSAQTTELGHCLQAIWAMAQKIYHQ